MTESGLPRIDQIWQAFELGESCLRHAPVKEFPKVEFRWFLTRTFPSRVADNQQYGTHLIFIGMNPAEARVFAGTPECGDWTCGYLVNRRINDEFPKSFGAPTRLSFVNLVPIVDKQPDRAEQKWTMLQEYHDEILDINVEILRKMLAESQDYIVIPAFGVDLNASDWRWRGFCKLLPVLEKIEEPDSRIMAVGRGDRVPYHPRMWPQVGPLGEAFRPVLGNLQALRRKYDHKTSSPRSS